MDGTYGHLRSHKEGMKLWGKFGDTPINNDDEIDTNFYDLDGSWLFDKGTDRFEIMHWFEEVFENFVCGEIMDMTSDDVDEDGNIIED